MLLLQDGRLLGALDLDSPAFNWFNAADQAGLKQLASVFVAETDFE